MGNSLGFNSSETPISDLAQIDVVMDAPGEVRFTDARTELRNEEGSSQRAKSKKLEQSNAAVTADREDTNLNNSAQPPVELSQYLQDNTFYPSRAQGLNVEGVVIVGFTVLANGDLTDFKIIQNLGFGCDEAAVEALRKGPLWRPAQTNGLAVPSQAQVEVQFPPKQWFKVIIVNLAIELFAVFLLMILDHFNPQNP